MLPVDAARAAPPPPRPASPRCSPPQAAQRGQKQSAVTAPEADDPLADRYGDTELVQSAVATGRTWTDVAALAPALAGSSVLVRARVHNVRGKGKSAFLVLRQATATVQAALFVDDATVSKGMVKYASAIPRESIVDVEAMLVAPDQAIEACSQSQVGGRGGRAGGWLAMGTWRAGLPPRLTTPLPRPATPSQVELHVTSIRCVSRAAPLPFEVTDAARSAEAVRKAAEAGEVLVTVGQVRCGAVLRLRDRAAAVGQRPQHGT